MRGQRPPGGRPCSAVQDAVHRLSVRYTDSTHLRANANKSKFKRELVDKSTRDYIAELNRDVAKDRLAHGKKPLRDKVADEEQKEIKVSTTDPDRGYMVRDGKPKGFFYLDHRTVDGRHGLITDSHVTPGNVHDSIPYLSRLDRQRERFGFEVSAVGLDAGYFTAPICYGLVKREIYGVIGYSRPTHREGCLRKSEFIYDEYYDCYLCPSNHALKYRTTTREGYREYASDSRRCCDCDLRGQCTQSRNKVKIITRHIWQDSKEQINDHRYEARGKAIYGRRKETVERSFADGKQLHGHRYARFRGLLKVKAQCLLSAACQNMKKITLIVHRKGQSSFLTDFYAPMGLQKRLSSLVAALKTSQPNFIA